LSTQSEDPLISSKSQNTMTFSLTLGGTEDVETVEEISVVKITSAD
jgi:hypothetical protein